MKYECDQCSMLMQMSKLQCAYRNTPPTNKYKLDYKNKHTQKNHLQNIYFHSFLLLLLSFAACLCLVIIFYYPHRRKWLFDPGALLIMSFSSTTYIHTLNTQYSSQVFPISIRPLAFSFPLNIFALRARRRTSRIVYVHGERAWGVRMHPVRRGLTPYYFSFDIIHPVSTEQRSVFLTRVRTTEKHSQTFFT